MLETERPMMCRRHVGDHLGQLLGGSCQRRVVALGAVGTIDAHRLAGEHEHVLGQRFPGENPVQAREQEHRRKDQLDDDVFLRFRQRRFPTGDALLVDDRQHLRLQFELGLFLSAVTVCVRFTHRCGRKLGAELAANPLRQLHQPILRPVHTVTPA